MVTRGIAFEYSLVQNDNADPSLALSGETGAETDSENHHFSNPMLENQNMHTCIKYRTRRISNGSEKYI